MKKIMVFSILLLYLTGCSNGNEPILETFSKINGEFTIQNQIGISLKEEQLIDEILNDMTLEEKVAQLFIVDIDTYINMTDVTDMSEALMNKINTHPVGGVIMFSKNIVDQTQIVKLNEEMQSISKIPLWISVDEEGGRVSRLGNNPQVGMTIIPSAQIIGNTLEPYRAYQIGKILGSELNALGFNMDFAPIGDINTNPNNPVIGDRSFSADPTLVADMVIQEVKGLQENDVAAVVKHFPGHGDTALDTHTGIVTVEHDITRLRNVELIPFQSAIQQGTLGIMVAHINLPNVTYDERPASLSPIIITGLLREEMEFKGLIITDALNMGAIKDQYTAKEASLEAFKAGVDILLMPEDFELAYEGVLLAIMNGDITQERLDASVRRILQAKLDLGLFDENMTRQPLSTIGSTEHNDVINEIMQRGY